MLKTLPAFVCMYLLLPISEAHKACGWQVKTPALDGELLRTRATVSLSHPRVPSFEL